MADERYFNNEDGEIESLIFTEIDEDGEMEVIVELDGLKGSYNFFIDSTSLDGLLKHIENEKEIHKNK